MYCIKKNIVVLSFIEPICFRQNYDMAYLDIIYVCVFAFYN